MNQTRPMEEALQHFKAGFIAKHGSARWAKNRLKLVIAADRAAVPCGRWVRIERPIRIPKLDGWLGIFPATRAPLWRTYRPVKPRYRYEVRR